MSTSQIFKTKKFYRSLLKGTVLNFGLQLANRSLNKKLSKDELVFKRAQTDIFTIRRH